MLSTSVIPGQNLTQPEQVAALIDHTLLKPEATQHAIAQLCAEAREYHFAAVCINPCWVRFAKSALAGSNVRVCTVIGFPLGANEMRTKMAEAEYALSEGATELDMVQNIGALCSGDLRFVRDEIAALARTAHASVARLKVILETCLLTDAQKITASKIATEALADFVKTSTGFSSAGATVEDVRLMRQTAAPTVGVKASGGVRTLAAVRQMVAAGANRIGTSSGVTIMRELNSAALDEPALPTSGQAVY